MSFKAYGESALVVALDSDKSGRVGFLSGLFMEVAPMFDRSLFVGGQQ